MCLDQGVGIIPYFPLAGGILSGKYSSSQKAPEGSRAQTDPNFSRFIEDKTIALGEGARELAAEISCTPSVLSLAWLIHQPVVSTVIVGATSVKQVQENLRSVDLKLDAEAVQKLDSFSSSYRYGEPFAFYRLP